MCEATAEGEGSDTRQIWEHRVCRDPQREGVAGSEASPTYSEDGCPIGEDSVKR